MTDSGNIDPDPKSESPAQSFTSEPSAEIAVRPPVPEDGGKPQKVDDLAWRIEAVINEWRAAHNLEDLPDYIVLGEIISILEMMRGEMRRRARFAAKGE
jgi:hypothetical protein